MRSWIGCDSCVRLSSWWRRCTWTWWRCAAAGTPESGYVSGRDPRVRVCVRKGPQSQGMCQGGTPESGYVSGREPKVRVCIREGPQSQGMYQGETPESGYASERDPRVRVCVIIHIARSGLRSLLGLGFLYYAEISHWFVSRLWSPDWNVWNRDGDLFPGQISFPKMGTVTIWETLHTGTRIWIWTNVNISA